MTWLEEVDRAIVASGQSGDDSSRHPPLHDLMAAFADTPLRNHPLPTTSYELPTTYYLLPTTYYLLRYLLPTTYYVLPTTYYELRTTDRNSWPFLANSPQVPESFWPKEKGNLQGGGYVDF